MAPSCRVVTEPRIYMATNAEGSVTSDRTLIWRSWTGAIIPTILLWAASILHFLPAWLSQLLQDAIDARPNSPLRSPPYFAPGW